MRLPLVNPVEHFARWGFARATLWHAEPYAMASRAGTGLSAPVETRGGCAFWVQWVQLLRARQATGILLRVILRCAAASQGPLLRCQPAVKKCRL